MGRYFDTNAAVATLATVATKPPKPPVLSQKSQKSQPVTREKSLEDNVIDLRCAFEERAAIMEYDAGLCRADAERAAAIATGYQPELYGQGNSKTSPASGPQIKADETNGRS